MKTKFRILTLTVAFLCSSLFHTAQGQNDKTASTVTISVTDAKIEDVLEQIEKTSGYMFFYPEGVLDECRPVTVDVKDRALNYVLDIVFKGTDVDYEINGNQVSLRKVNRPSVPSLPKNSGKRRLVGKVTDADTEEPLVGVTINITGTNEIAVTDVEGNYFIDLPKKKTDISVYCLGYITKNIAVGDLAILDIKMEGDNEMLDGVVVVGAGTQKKVSVTGSISSIKGDFLRAPSSSLTSGFAGKLAGVISATSSGEPGSTSDFYIRGVSTFGGRATPLILLDDVEISAGDLNRLPAESIESFSILKDASATAIYGARGANGVMIITTKQGEENTRAKINVTLETSFFQPVNKVEYVDGVTWLNMYNEATLTRTPTATPKYNQNYIENTASGINPYVFPNVDWYDELFKEFNMNQRANINLQGGGSKVTYYMGLQVNHDAGLLDVPKISSLSTNINNWNYVFQNNISYKPTQSTTIDLRLNAQFGNLQGPGSSTKSIFNAVYNANPVEFPMYYPAQEGDRHIRFANTILTDSRLNVNPYAKMLESFKETNFSTINASLKVKQNLDFITKGLSISMLVNMKAFSTSDYTNTITPYYYQAMSNTWSPDEPDYYNVQLLQSGSDYINQGGINRYSDQTFYFDARINYNRRFKDHSVSGMLMYMMRDYRNNVLPQRNQGLSGRATYDYANKYLVEFNFGYNGTERLAKGKRFEFFPAVSLGWVPSNETFWTPVKNVISHLKVRGSYGLVGSDETGLASGAAHFLYKNQINMNTGSYFNTGVAEGSNIYFQGPAVTQYATDNACWERSKKFDIGLDLHLFNELFITVDYFNELRYNILMARSSWPSLLGYGSAVPWSNIGEVRNMGYELSLSWKRELISGMYIDLRGNLTYTRNRYEYIDEPDYPYPWLRKTGDPISAIYGYEAVGLFRDWEDIETSPSQKNLGSEVMPGDIKYVDQNGDGMITSDDIVMLSPYGHMPGIQYGFGLNWTYKNFDFGVFFTGSANRTIMISGIAPFCSDDGNQDRNLMKFIADDYWSESNPNPRAAYPRLGVSKPQVANNLVASSYWMRNGNFIRFKTLEFGYSFKIARVYLSGDNIAVWSPFKLWDPELTFDAYPLQRTFNLGVQFKI